MTKIEHVFVLMMENRSFDHFFGFSGLPGVPEPSSEFGFKRGAVDSMQNDPPHEFDDVKAQVANGAMTGFAQIAATGNMLGFRPDQIPVLSALAGQYLLMDNWFSSMPGPTWPNRFFAHAASSGGLDNSPAGYDAADAVYKPDRSFDIQNGHIFHRLTTCGKTWRVYHGRHDRPQVLALDGMVGDYFNTELFRTHDELAADLTHSDAANYTWIEPTYAPLSSYRNGDSQHPLGSVSAGEALIKNVYNAVRQSPLWHKSVLLITWDEHGGFFDSMRPPAAVQPGDAPLSHDRGQPKRDFDFKLLGPRVPAILISPLLPTGLGSTIFPQTAFDHSSIVASLRAIFELGAPLTQRDASAPSWTTAELPAARPDAGAALRIKTPALVKLKPADLNTASIKKPMPGSLAGFVSIARGVDYQMAKLMGVQPLQHTTHAPSLAKAHAFATAGGTAANAVAAHRSALSYLAAVDTREAALRKMQRGKGRTR